jgi:cytidylate kinase
MKPVIVFGPAACGKTVLKHEIARALQLSHIVDGATEEEIAAPKPDTLYLTNLSGEEVHRVAPIGTIRRDFDQMKIRRLGGMSISLQRRAREVIAERNAQ